VDIPAMMQLFRIKLCHVWPLIYACSRMPST